MRSRPHLTALLLSLTAVAPLAAQEPTDDPDPVAEAELLERRAEERAREVERYFTLCDLDGNGWISFREAELTLGLSRTEFRRYDADSDGRLDAEEFATRQLDVLELLGAIRSPTRPEGLPVDPRPTTTAGGTSAGPTPLDLQHTYDRDGSGGLGRSELEDLFEEIRAPVAGVSAALQMDTDGSGQLEPDELKAVAMLVSRRQPAGRPWLGPAGVPTGMGERVIPRPRNTGPPQILGTVGHFRRLDLDDNGYIDVLDLDALTAPANLGLRAGTILAAIDRDGDGRLDRGELMSSLGAPTPD